MPHTFTHLGYKCISPDWYIYKYYLGLEGCRQEMMQEYQCKKGDLFVYGVNNNCCCVQAGSLQRINTAGCQQATTYIIKQVITYNIHLVPSFTRNKCINKCQSDMEAVLIEETNKWQQAQPTVVGQCNKVSSEYTLQ